MTEKITVVMDAQLDITQCAGFLIISGTTGPKQSLKNSEDPTPKMMAT